VLRRMTISLSEKEYAMLKAQAKRNLDLPSRYARKMVKKALELVEKEKGN